MTVVDKFAEELRRNSDIVYAGLKLSPLKVSQYALYRTAAGSFELMLASLPPQMARLSWFQALDKLDSVYHAETGKQGVYLTSAVCVIAAAMGLDGSSKFQAMRNTKGNISAVCVQKDGGAFPIMLTMSQIDEIRQLIAAQNGYKLPDENWSLDLYRAAKYLEQQQNSRLGLSNDIEELVYSVAVNSGTDANLIWDWPIKKLLYAQRAIDRKLGYIIYNLAELSGNVKFEKGQPFPVWQYSRTEDKPTAFRSLAEIEGTAEKMLHSDKTQTN